MALPAALCFGGLSFLLMSAGCDHYFQKPSDDLASLAVESPERTKSGLDSIGGERLRVELDAVIDSANTNRLLSSQQNAAWQIMHGVLCFGQELPLATPDRGKVSALQYAFDGGSFQGWELSVGDLLPATSRRGVKAKLEPGSFIGQGHVDQWLAIFAMANLPADTSVKVNNESFTVADWARQAQWDTSSNPLREYSWTLIALTHYFPDEPSWTANDGTTWSWEQLVEREVVYDLNLSPCGGTHRLMGLVLALQSKRRMNLANSPTWDRAEKVVREAISAIKSMQNSDGSLSSHYLARPGTTADLGLMLGSTGHLLEFLSVALPKDELAKPWMELAAHRVCEILQVTGSVDLDCGALYHAVRGLKLYREGRFNPKNVDSPVVGAG